jgi:hypothetical protein
VQEYDTRAQGTPALCLLRHTVLLLLYSLHSECFCIVGPVILSSADFGEGESTAGYTFTPGVGSFACPGIDTQVEKGSPQQVTHLPPVWDLLLALA